MKNKKNNKLALVLLMAFFAVLSFGACGEDEVYTNNYSFEAPDTTSTDNYGIYD